MQLRPYQQQLINDIRLQYQLGRKSVLAVLPTGGGKTVCFSYIAEQASRKGNRVLVLVHRQELLDQASRAMPMPHGRISAGKTMDLSHAVQVASVQTVARRLHLLPRDFFQLLVVDEAHHTTAGTWAKVIEHFHGAKLLGVTATPIRSDGRGLGEHYQSMVEGPTAQWLTEHGFLAAAKVLAPPGFDTTGLRKRMGDFDPKEAEQRVGTIMGDCLGHYRKHLAGQTAIAFCCSVAHAEAVADLFRSAGIAAASIDGTMDANTRRQLLEDLGTGRIKVLTSCALIGEGVDVPSVGGCILLRPTASVALHLQMIGRCLRPQPGKRAVVLDHVGNTLRLGHHLEERDWTLDGLKKRDRENAPSVKVCPQCFATSASAVQTCRECGHVFAPQERRELQQVDGELVEIKAKAGSSLAISVGDIVFVGTGIQGRATAVNVLRILRTKIAYWPVGKEQKLANSYYHAWHYNVLEFKRGQLVQKRDSKTDSWEDGWVFYDYSETGKRCTIIKKDDYNFNENQPFKPWAIGSTTHRKVLTHNVKAIDALSTGDRAYEQSSARDLESLRQLAQQRGYKRGWAERVYQARLAKRQGI